MLAFATFLRIIFVVLQKPCHENFAKFQEFNEGSFGGSEKDRYFLKIVKWQHKLVGAYKRGKLVSYFLINAAKTYLYGLKTLEDIEIEHVFQSKAFFHLSGNLHTSCLSGFKDIRNLLRLERETKAIKDRILRDIKNLSDHEKEEVNFYKPVKINNF